MKREPDYQPLPKTSELHPYLSGSGKYNEVFPVVPSYANRRDRGSVPIVPYGVIATYVVLPLFGLDLAALALGHHRCNKAAKSRAVVHP